MRLICGAPGTAWITQRGESPRGVGGSIPLGECCGDAPGPRDERDGNHLHMPSRNAVDAFPHFRGFSPYPGDRIVHCGKPFC